LKRALGGDWHACDNALAEITQLIHTLEENPLQAAARGDVEHLAATLADFRNWSETLETRAAPTVEAQLFLAHPQLVAPENLRSRRLLLLERLAAGEEALSDESLLADFQKWCMEYGRIYSEWHRAQNDVARLAEVRRVASGDALRALEAWDAVTGDAPLAAAVREPLNDALRTLCPRDGTLAREPVCVSCRLRLGENLLIDTQSFLAAMEEARTTLRTKLAALKNAPGLQNEAGAALRAWLEADDSLENLWPLLHQDGLQALREALHPPMPAAPVPPPDVSASRAVRSFAALRVRLEKCRTRAEAEGDFQAWLDGAERPAREARIEWRD
jgi:hypothetical protein